MRERVRSAPNDDYVEAVLRPRFEVCYPVYFEHLLTVHRAWIVMLARQAILDRAKAVRILDGLSQLAAAGSSSILPFEPAKEEVYLHVESALGKLIGAEM